MKKNFTKKDLKANSPIFDYHDRFAFVLGSLFIAGLLCYYAYKGGMLEGMTTGSFYVAFFTFFFIIFLVLLYIRWCVRRLDRKLSWLNHWFMRLVYQAVLCWMVPTIALFGLYLLFYEVLPADVLASGLLEVDLPWICILLMVVNLLYILVFSFELNNWHLKMGVALKNKCKHYYKLLTHAFAEIRMLQENNQKLIENECALIAQHALEMEELRAQVRRQEAEKASSFPPEELAPKTIASIYTVRTQKLTSRHKYGDIACFTYKKPFTYLETIDGKQQIPANESSLVKVEEATDGFFRKIVREMAVPQHMMLACRRIKDGKLLLILKEPLNCEVEISKESVPRLRDWILEAVGEITNEQTGD